MTEFPTRKTITFEQTGSSGVAINDTVRGGDFDTVRGDRQINSNEIKEPYAIELVDPPQNADGSIQTIEYVRLHDGNEAYPGLRFPFWMLGHSGPNYDVQTPSLGVPVLSNRINPNNYPLLTATPKFGPNDSLNIEVQNDGTAIDDTFAIRVHYWYFEGSEQELENYFRTASNLTHSVQQNLTLSNPFENSSGRWQNQQIDLTASGRGSVHKRFTHLTGGTEQSLPKVWPWATWATNADATRTNRPYELRYPDNVDNAWNELFFDFSGGEEAALFNYIMVREDVANLNELRLTLASRDSEEVPVWDVSPTDRHELPVIRRLDDNSHVTADQREVPIGRGGVPADVTVVDDLPTRLARDVQRAETFVWDDEGGISIVDDGTSVAADDVRVGAFGRKLELED